MNATTKTILSLIFTVGLITVIYFETTPDLSDKTRSAAILEKEVSGANPNDLTLSPEQFLAYISSGAVLIDVRTKEEYEVGHIKDAVNIDFYSPTFKEKIGELDKTKNYALYCRSGRRSREAVALMRESGFGSITDLDGGITAWQSLGMETLCADGKVCLK